MDHSLLQQEIATLRHHAEADRIKKLIYWVCEQDWPRRTETLADLDELLPQLLAIATTTTNLRELLLKGVSTLSKPQKYTEIALVICTALAALYSDKATAAQPPLDPFELRLAVIKYTVPVHAKILMQSALDPIFTGHRRDWVALRQTSLDTLLMRLCQRFVTFSELETHLQLTARQIQVLDQPLQVMAAVLQAVKPVYASQQISPPVTVAETTAFSQRLEGPLRAAAEDVTMLKAVHNSQFFPAGA